MERTPLFTDLFDLLVLIVTLSVFDTRLRASLVCWRYCSNRARIDIIATGIRTR